MRYASIRSMDISNGEGVGISLFVQGCHFYCKGCFNKDTWDFNGGKKWTPEVEDKFMELASKPYIKRISLLGGECLADENLDEILSLVNKLRLTLPEKTIWLYTGYEWEKIMWSRMPHPPHNTSEEFLRWNQRHEIVSKCDVVIDGRYIEEQRDISLKWRGSSNQRVIDVKKSLEQNEVVLYCD